jgi:serine/threonine protein kinase
LDSNARLSYNENDPAQLSEPWNHWFFLFLSHLCTSYTDKFLWFDLIFFVVLQEMATAADAASAPAEKRLADVLSSQKFTLQQKCVGLLQLAEALSKLHERKQCYDFVAPKNVMVDGAHGSCTWKKDPDVVTDEYTAPEVFQFRIDQPLTDSPASSSSKLVTDNSSSASASTSASAASRSASKPTFAMNVYGFGRLMFYVICGYDPWSNEQLTPLELIHEILQGSHPKQLLYFQEFRKDWCVTATTSDERARIELKDWMLRCCEREPAKRCSLRDVIVMLKRLTQQNPNSNQNDNNTVTAASK